MQRHKNLCLDIHDLLPRYPDQYYFEACITFHCTLPNNKMYLTILHDKMDTPYDLKYILYAARYVRRYWIYQLFHETILALSSVHVNDYTKVSFFAIGTL